MMNMYPMQGLGSNGLGMGNGMGMSPQLMAMMGGGMGGGMGAPQASPLAPGAAPTPLSAMIGGGSMQRPMMGGGGGMPGIPAGAGQPPAQSNPLAAMLSTPQGLQQLLTMLKGGQNGLAPQASGQPGGGMPAVPDQMAPGMGTGGIDALLRSMGMFGGATGGAPT